MFVTKAPLRVSFFGGGTDLPEFFEQGYVSQVISVAIDVNMHIVINGSPQNRVKACYDVIEIEDSASKIKHDRIRNCLQAYNIDHNIEVSSFCHIPTKGTGLGSSSTFTVALCSALESFKNPDKKIDKKELAEQAFYIERVLCGENLGKQDQYAASFGGFKCYQFQNKEVNVQEILNPANETWEKLEGKLLFFYTGITRVANDLLKEQANNINIDNLIHMVDISSIAKTYLIKGRLDEIGDLLDVTWNAKKRLHNNVTSPIIDEYYHTAIKHGALGGKLLGAGGGGFLMFYVPEKHQLNVVQALEHLKQYRFKFNTDGASLVYQDV